MVDEAIATTPGKKTVVGESMGAAVVAEEKSRLMASDNPPPAGDITFVTCR